MDSTRLQEGMIVYGSHGEKLGKIVGRARDTFVIEKGTFFPKEYVARYEDVAEISGNDVRLTRGKEALGALERGAAVEGPLGEASPTGAGGGAETIATAPVETAPEEPAAPPARPRGDEHDVARAVRLEEEGGTTVTFGMGEDPGATQARRDDFDIDEG